MGWLDEQIKQRKENDDQLFADSFKTIAASVTGKKNYNNEFDEYADAIKSILNFYHCSYKEESGKTFKDFQHQLDYATGTVGFKYRQIKLTEGWYKDAIGAILGFTKQGKPVAIIPALTGYIFYDQDKQIKVTHKTSELLEEEAYCFYKPFPNRKITIIDLAKYAISTVPIGQIITLAALSVFATLIGLVLPKLSFFLYGDVITEKSITLFSTTIIFLICATISRMLFSTYQSMYTNIIYSNIDSSIQAASFNRLLSLPVKFFRQYSSGELASRLDSLNSLTNTIIAIGFNGVFSSLTSLAYVTSIFQYAPQLTIPAVSIILITVLFSLFTVIAQNKISKEVMEMNAKESGLSYSIVNGIRKIRLSGAEKRVFAIWADKYAKKVKLRYNPPFVINYNGSISLAISLVGTIVMYYISIVNNINTSEYYAFTTAYSMMFSAISSIVSIIASTTQIKSIYEMAKPIMDQQPEEFANKEMVERLTGNIEFNNVSFRYEENMPLIVDDLTLKIKPGQYVAIVGKTGCGKSTLIRLLLGFEKPQKGSIYYDNKDINSLDLRTLRKKIGVVMQDGDLLTGEIIQNIKICAPELTMEEAYQVADMAGIGDDIRKMPMGMHTMISDGNGGISGGQKQRLLIARALAGKPSVLIFDEATSALDNITQRNISQALDQLHCTRIVIAHRLSTIKHCDRIIYLEDGKIREDGTYQELIDKNGMFAQLVKRQMIEDKKEDITNK